MFSYIWENQCVTSFTSIDEKLLQLLSNQLGSINWKASISKFKHCSINKCCRTKKAERSHDFEKAEKAVPEGGGRKERGQTMSQLGCLLASWQVSNVCSAKVNCFWPATITVQVWKEKSFNEWNYEKVIDKKRRWKKRGRGWKKLKRKK